MIIPRAAIGPALSARIKGREDVECLRRLVRGTGGQEDIRAALQLMDKELEVVAYEDWDEVAKKQHAREATDIIALRNTLRHLATTADEDRMISLSRATSSDFPVPTPEGMVMYPFQRAGVEYAQGRDFVLIADDMGVGKTIQAIGILNTHPDPGRVLVVCTATLKGNWANEIARWSTRPYVVDVIGSKKINPDATLTIINYDLLDKRTLPGEYQTVIVDEAHYLRNIDTARTQAALPYLQKARLRIALTGTPIPTSPYDLWPLVSISGLPLAAGYLERYVTETERDIDNGYGKRVPITPRRRGINQEELQRRLRASCMVARKKENVLPQLPLKTRQIIEVGSAAKMDEQVALRISRLLEGDDDYRRAAFANPSPDSIDGQISRLRQDEAIAKVPLVVKHVIALLDDNRDKIVLFGFHKEVIRLLTEKLDKYHPLVITGETPTEKRTGIVEKFQTDPRHRIFIGNIHAAGEGITLHAASLAVFAELDWQFHRVAQAEDRIHRIGQNDPVLIQHIVTSGGIDSMIVMAMIAKQSEAQRVVG